MSEAELHVLRARLHGGLLNKARRGELKLALPVGLVYDARDRVTLDPDQQVQGSLRTFFQAFQRTGSASATVKFFRQEGLLFPRRLRRGVQKGELVWGPLVHNRALQTLHNPRYSGTYVWGRYRVEKSGRRKTPRRLPKTNGTCSFPTPIPATSIGASTSKTSSVFGRTPNATVRIAARVHPARVQRCCRAW